MTDSPGYQRPLLRPFLRQNGRTVIVPIDHGTAIPVPELGSTGALIEVLKPFADGFVVNYGVARSFRQELARRGVCLRTDVYKPARPGQPDHGAWMTYGATEATRCGVHGVMHMLYTHHPDEARMFRESARLISDSHAAGFAVITEALPFGIGRPADYTPENIGFAVRAAAELGADVVKTAWPGSREAFRKITESSFVPVIVLGGSSSSETEILRMVEDSIAAGGAGVAIGRNVWQHPNPALMLRRIQAIVHLGATAADAAALSA